MPSRIIAGIWIKLRAEERLVATHFPEYTAYSAQTKSLIAFVF